MRAYRARIATRKGERLKRLREEAVNKAAYLAVKFDGNWADEMDLTGVRVMTHNEWVYFKRTAEEGTYPYKHPVGTNEELHYTSANDFLSDFRPTPIPKYAYEGFKKAVGGEQAGEFVWPGEW